MSTHFCHFEASLLPETPLVYFQICSFQKKSNATHKKNSLILQKKRKKNYIGSYLLFHEYGAHVCFD